jgi:hypothetical protein
MKNIILSLLSLILLSSCRSQEAKKFKNLLEQSTGQKYSIEKLYTENGKYVVYQNKVTGEYVAYNLSKYDSQTVTSLDQYLSRATFGVDIVGNLSVFRDETYDDDGDRVTRFYYYTDGFIFNSVSSTSKDLEVLAYLDETAAESYIAVQLTNDFSFSTDRAFELARLTTQYKKLESMRSLSSSEKDQFSLKALGVSFKQIERSIKANQQGESSELSSLIEKAALLNRTTPEQMGRFFSEVLESEVFVN